MTPTGILILFDLCLLLASGFSLASISPSLSWGIHLTFDLRTSYSSLFCTVELPLTTVVFSGSVPLRAKSVFKTLSACWCTIGDLLFWDILSLSSLSCIHNGHLFHSLLFSVFLRSSLKTCTLSWLKALNCPAVCVSELINKKMDGCIRHNTKHLNWNIRLSLLKLMLQKHGMKCFITLECVSCLKFFVSSCVSNERNTCSCVPVFR